jgi:hypothetical protein
MLWNQQPRLNKRTPNLLLQGLDLLLQSALLQRRYFWLRTTCGVHRPQIALDALIDLRHTPLHFRVGEVLVAVVHCLELAAVDGDQCLRK